MIAAMYARESTEQVGADADAKSVANQIGNARDFAQEKGWSRITFRWEVVASTESHTVAWELGTAKPVAHVRGGIAGKGLAISRDGRYLATADSREMVRLRTLPTLTDIGRWSLQDLGCREVACAVAFSPDNSRLIIAGWEGVLRQIALPLNP